MNWWEWLIYGSPWWFQAIMGGGIIVLVLIPLTRFIGLTKTLQLASIVFSIFGALVYGRRERQQGWKDRENKGERDANAAITLADQARQDANARNSVNNGKQLRDDDGFKRK